MKISVFVLLLALLVAGCVTPFRAPSDVAHIQLDPVDSPTVIVEKIWLERHGGPLVVKGYVLKRLQAMSTSHTHLDVTLFDAGGGVLRTSVAHFKPQEIVRRMNRPGQASYRVALGSLPAGTSRIEVRAHEEPHS